MRYSGSTLCVGDHIDTDAIIPARYLVTSDPKELGSHCMEGLDPNWLKKVTPGAVNAEVQVDLPGGKGITSIVTMGSVDKLALATGKKITAIVKASQAILAVPK